MKNKEHIQVKGYYGKWYVIDETTYHGKKYYMLEHEYYGDETPPLVVDSKLNVICDDTYMDLVKILKEVLG